MIPHQTATPPESGQSPVSIPLLSVSEAPAIVCETCHSDQYLVYEQVTPVPAAGRVPAAWDVECWCGRCEEFYGVRTTRAPSLPYSILEHGFNVGS